MVTMDKPTLANILGFASLISYVVTLLPTILRTVFPQTKETGIPKWLLKRRRLIGVIAFFLALGHGFLMVKKRNFDFFDLKTFWIYIQGITTLTIFTLLTITSNDWSVKRLKSNWKKLHNSTYLLIFLLLWHILASMAKHWSYLTPFGVLIIVTTSVFFIKRKWIEQIELKRKQEISQQIK